MALYLYKNPKTGIYYVRGSHHGIAVDESAFTRVKSDAEGVKERREREIYEAVVLKKPRERTYAEAAYGYMKSGGEKEPQAAILQAKVRVDGKDRIFGELLLREIDQSVVDDLAAVLKPKVAKATQNRYVYTPVSAALTWAGDQKSWGYQHGRLRRPPKAPGRLDWRTPQEIEWWLKRAGPEKAIITGYVGTGARASELTELDWPDVTPQCHRFTLWEADTKAGRARGVDLQTRVRGALPPRPANGQGPVFVNAKGARWTVIAVQKALDRITAREVRLVAGALEQEQIAELVHRAGSKAFEREARNAARRELQQLYEAIAARENVPWIHPHVLRHTWATWAYAVTRDLAWLMSQGGWAKPDMAMRYTHVAAADLAEDVLAHGWDIRPMPNRDRPKALPPPDSA